MSGGDGSWRVVTGRWCLTRPGLRFAVRVEAASKETWKTVGLNIISVEHFWTRLPRLSMAYPSWDSRGKRPLIARTPIFFHTGLGTCHCHKAQPCIQMWPPTWLRLLEWGLQCQFIRIAYRLERFVSRWKNLQPFVMFFAQEFVDWWRWWSFSQRSADPLQEWPLREKLNDWTTQNPNASKNFQIHLWFVFNISDFGSTLGWSENWQPYFQMVWSQNQPDLCYVHYQGFKAPPQHEVETFSREAQHVGCFDTRPTSPRFATRPAAAQTTSPGWAQRWGLPLYNLENKSDQWSKVIQDDPRCYDLDWFCDFQFQQNWIYLLQKYNERRSIWPSQDILECRYTLQGRLQMLLNDQALKQCWVFHSQRHGDLWGCQYVHMILGHLIAEIRWQSRWSQPLVLGLSFNGRELMKSQNARKWCI